MSCVSQSDLRLFTTTIVIDYTFSCNRNRNCNQDLTVYGRSGTQCPSTYTASSIRNGWEPSAMSPLLGRKQLMACNRCNYSYIGIVFEFCLKVPEYLQISVIVSNIQ